MKERSGMPYDVVAYEADEQAMLLSAEEEGFFHRLMRRAWMNGSIPDDVDKLAVIARAVSKNQFRRAWENIKPLWTPHPTEAGRLINRKLESEREWVLARDAREEAYQAELRERQSVKGKLSAESRARKANQSGNHGSTTVQPDINHGSQPAATTVQPPSPPLPIPPLKEEKNLNTLSAKADDSSPKYPMEFEEFWKISTQRGSKKDAAAVWKKLRPDGELRIAIWDGMAKWQDSAQWQDETMQPHISTWLGRRGWEEIVPRSAPSKPAGHVHNERCRDYGYCPEAR